MTLENIETFLVLASTQNFSRTAEMMYVAQSTITNRIKQLEQELNCTLFTRTAKSVSITNAGLDFLQYAQKISTLSKESVDRMRSYESFERTVNICATDAIWRYFLHSLFPEYVSQNPKTAFKFYTQDSREVAQLVISGTVDIGAGLIDVFHPEVERLTLFKDPFCLVAAPHLVPAGTVISPENIREFPYIHANWSFDFNEWYDRNYHCRNYHLEIGQTTYIDRWVRAGLGIAFFPRCAVKDELKSGQLVEIPFDPGSKLPQYVGHLIYMKRNEEKLKDVIDAILQHVNGQ